jgi:two-component system, sensor histidine kinase and response regulator
VAKEKTAPEKPVNPGHADQRFQNRIEHPSLRDGSRVQDVLLGCRVLLVDDEPINRKVAVAILRKIGMETEAAGTGAEALQLIEANDYSLVLMDLHMPEMSGFEAAKKIRAHEKKTDRKRMTIIAMTANDAQTTRGQCLAAGMDDFLTKPIHSDVLIEHVIPLLNKDRKIPPPVSSESVPAATLSGQELWNRTQALKFLGGDEALFGELAAVFIGRNELLLKNIATAIEHGDAEALQDAAHAYKGAVGHFASPVLRKSAIALENLAKEGRLDGGAVHLTSLRQNSRLLCSDLYQLITDSRPG